MITGEEETKFHTNLMKSNTNKSLTRKEYRPQQARTSTEITATLTHVRTELHREKGWLALLRLHVKGGIETSEEAAGFVRTCCASKSASRRAKTVRSLALTPITAQCTRWYQWRLVGCLPTVAQRHSATKNDTIQNIVGRCSLSPLVGKFELSSPQS
jgi:hypothetical protein